MNILQGAATSFLASGMSFVAAVAISGSSLQNSLSFMAAGNLTGFIGLYCLVLGVNEKGGGE